MEDHAWIAGVYALSAHANPDAFDFAVVLSPFNQTNLVATHYAIVAATGGRRIAGKVLYVNAAMTPPTPMYKARKLALSELERAGALKRIAERRAQWEQSPERVEVEAAFKRFAMAEFEAEMQRPANAPPYRGAITIDFARGILEIVPDPFPSGPRPRVLLVTEDPETAGTLIHDFEVVHVDDGWAAVEHVEKTNFDVILCSLRVGGMSGASLHRLIAKTRPEAAAKIAFLASAGTAAAAPPSSASGRILALPITAAQVRALLSL